MERNIVTFRENTSLSLNSPPFYSVVKPVLNTGRYTRNIITSLYTPLPTTGGEISQSFGPFVFYETLMNRPYFKINFRATWLEYFAAFHRRAVRLFYNSRISAGSVSLIVRISLILPRKIETFSLSLSFQQRNRTLIPEICILGTSVRIFHLAFLFISSIYSPLFIFLTIPLYYNIIYRRSRSKEEEEFSIRSTQHFQSFLPRKLT